MMSSASTSSRTPSKPDHESAWVLAYGGGEAVGIGVGRPSSIAGGSLYAMARVLPEHRRRGVGHTLYAALSEHARNQGRTSLGADP